jgi:hypothetical protein
MATNIHIQIGADYSALYVVRSQGQAVDITGATFTGKLRGSLTSGVVVATLTAEIVDAAAGQFSLAIPAATTADLLPGNGVWDLTMALDGLLVPVVVDARYTISLRAAR